MVFLKFKFLYLKVGSFQQHEFPHQLIFRDDINKL